MKYLSILLSLTFAISAFAEDHADVNTRNLPDEKKQIQEEVIQKELVEEAQAEEDEIQTGVFDNRLPPIYFPYSCHSLASLSALGDTIIIEDGSTWSLSPHYSNVIMSWKSSDHLFFYPNRSWFSSHKYTIVNQITGESVPVTLTKGPIINGEYSLQIVTIDFAKGQVFLNDDSIWLINSSDHYLLEEWRVGDYIIIGYNNSWFSSSKNILLNSNMYNHVRANSLN